MMSTYKGQEQQRRKIQHMIDKRDKLLMLEALIWSHEHAVTPDAEEIRDLKRRANELRNQLAVSSTALNSNYETERVKRRTKRNS